MYLKNDEALEEYLMTAARDDASLKPEQGAAISGAAPSNDSGVPVISAEPQKR
jgi:hypothetical protein